MSGNLAAAGKFSFRKGEKEACIFFFFRKSKPAFIFKAPTRWELFKVCCWISDVCLYQMILEKFFIWNVWTWSKGNLKMNENTIHRLYHLSYFDICLLLKFFTSFLLFPNLYHRVVYYIQKFQILATSGTSQLSSGIDSVVFYNAWSLMSFIMFDSGGIVT